ncbi:hypothetical protein ACLK1X_06580 [Escherichia coli]
MTFRRLKAAAKLASLCQTGDKVRFNVMAEHLMTGDDLSGKVKSWTK